MASVKKILRDYRLAREQRGTLDQQLEDITRIMAPRLIGFTSAPIDGDIRTEEIFDSTPMTAARSLANAVSSILFTDDFFSLGTESGIEEEDREARIWLDEATKRQQKSMDNPKARFKQTIGEVTFSLVTLGTAPFFVGLDLTKTRLSYQSIFLKDSFIGQTSEGFTNRIFRRWEAEAWKINEFFKDKPGPAVAEAMQDNKENTKFEYVHVVMPRKSGKKGALLSKNRPFTGDWIEVKTETRVEVGGFNNFPYVVPRWDTTSGEPYGRSPAMIALPDALTLQAMSETLLESGQRAADPPLLIPNDGVFDAPNTVPGGLVPYDVDIARELGRIPITPLDVGTNLPITRDMQNDTRDQVLNAFFRNVFNLPIGGPQMTATEVNARRQEFLREVGGVFGRLNADYVAPTVELTFEAMLEAGAFPEIPLSLQGQDVKFTYRDPINAVREQIESSQLHAVVLETAELAQASGRPDLVENFNLDLISRDKIPAMGLDEKYLIPFEAVIEQRQQRAQAAAQAEKDAAIAQTISVASDAAGAFKTVNDSLQAPQ